MKWHYLSILVFLVLSVGSYTYLSRSSKDQMNTICKGLSVNTLGSVFEVDTKFIVTKKGTIIFTGLDSNSIRLYELHNDKIYALTSSITNAFNPFFWGEQLSGLHDTQGNEKFYAIDSAIYDYIPKKPIKSLHSSVSGEQVVVQLEGDKNLYLLTYGDKQRKILLSDVNKVHDVVFYQNFIIINHDKLLWQIDTKTGVKAVLAQNYLDGKMNPFVHRDKIYFSNNDSSEHYQIYNTSIHDSEKLTLLYKSNHDVRMPKLKGKILYFLEIIRNEYLLKSYDLVTKEVNHITSQGVVYSYDFLQTNKIIFSYSDFTTPRSLMSYENGKIKNLTGRRLQLNLSNTYIEKNDHRSSGYVIQPSNRKLQGLILFVHPGLHSDFSPRWDSVLMNLSLNGFIIVCPNYPMSSGSGKSFYNSTMSQAVNDIVQWKSDIREMYPNLPLYYLTGSTGNILLENVLSYDVKDVSACAVLFGAPASDSPNPKTPTLFILGVNDPIINYKSRKLSLENANNIENVFVLSYGDEGHWFRYSTNIQHSIVNLLNFFCVNSNKY